LRAYRNEMYASSQTEYSRCASRVYATPSAAARLQVRVFSRDSSLEAR